MSAWKITSNLSDIIHRQWKWAHLWSPCHWKTPRVSATGTAPPAADMLGGSQMRLNMFLPRALARSCKNPACLSRMLCYLGGFWSMFVYRRYWPIIPREHNVLQGVLEQRNTVAALGRQSTQVHPTLSVLLPSSVTFSVILPSQQALQWQHISQNESIQLRSFQKGNLNFNWNSCRKKTSLPHTA